MKYKEIKWSQYNVEEDYKTNKIKDLVKIYSIPKHFIIKRVIELGLRKRSDYWTQEEIEMAKKNIVPVGRTRKAMSMIRINKGIARKLITREWSQSEEEVLKLNWDKKSVEEIAKLLNRTKQSIQNKKVKLNLFVDKTWSDTEKDILVGCTNITECIERLPNRTEYSIKHMIRRMGIKFESKRFSQPHQQVCLELRKLGLVYTIEYRIDKYLLDCFLPALNIGIEIDGSYWHKETKERDIKKDAFLQNKGIKVLRISEEEAKNSSIVQAKVIENIVNCWKLLLKEDNQQPS